MTDYSETVPQDTEPLVRGTFEPTGAVLCRVCARRSADQEEEDAASLWGEAPEHAASRCNACGAWIRLPLAIGLESALVQHVEAQTRGDERVRSVFLAQTGGMCSAGVVHLADGSQIGITWDPETRSFDLFHYATAEWTEATLWTDRAGPLPETVTPAALSAAILGATAAIYARVRAVLGRRLSAGGPVSLRLPEALRFRIPLEGGDLLLVDELAPLFDVVGSSGGAPVREPRPWTVQRATVGAFGVYAIDPSWGARQVDTLGQLALLVAQDLAASPFGDLVRAAGAGAGYGPDHAAIAGALALEAERRIMAARTALPWKVAQPIAKALEEGRGEATVPGYGPPLDGTIAWLRDLAGQVPENRVARLDLGDLVFDLRLVPIPVDAESSEDWPWGWVLVHGPRRIVLETGAGPMGSVASSTFQDAIALATRAVRLQLARPEPERVESTRETWEALGIDEDEARGVAAFWRLPESVLTGSGYLEELPDGIGFALMLGNLVRESAATEDGRPPHDLLAILWEYLVAEAGLLELPFVRRSWSTLDSVRPALPSEPDDGPERRVESAIECSALGLPAVLPEGHVLEVEPMLVESPGTVSGSIRFEAGPEPGSVRVTSAEFRFEPARRDFSEPHRELGEAWEALRAVLGPQPAPEPGEPLGAFIRRAVRRPS